MRESRMLPPCPFGADFGEFPSRRFGDPAGAVGPTAEPRRAGSDIGGAVPRSATPGRDGRWSNALVAGLVAVLGIVITAVLAGATWAAHSANEDRLLQQRTREVGAVLTAAIPTVQAPIVSAALLAEATNGDPVIFRQLAAPLIAKSRPFASVSLWSTTDPGRGPLVVVGKRPRLATEPAADAARLFARAGRSQSIAVHDLLRDPQGRRLGYTARSAGGGRYVVYAETTFPRDRRARVDRDSAFADLGYAMFLGPRVDSAHLLASSTGGARLAGSTARATVPFGDRQLLVVVAPQNDLGGGLLRNLPWIVAVAGLVLTGTSVAAVSLLGSRRHRAEMLAAENARLYAHQRTVAETLQHSLLPASLPAITNGEIAAVYRAGGEGLDVGGDWYDVLAVADDRFVVVVGDVSGRGLDAAAVMAALRFSIRAYAADGDGPAAILGKLNHLLSVRDAGHFATVLCGVVELGARRSTWASAGHFGPLVTASDPTTVEPVAVPPGPPVGVAVGVTYREVHHPLPARGALLLYTDGLVERRRENLEAGVARLAAAAPGVCGDGPLASALQDIVEQVTGAAHDDDIALLGVRWER